MNILTSYKWIKEYLNTNLSPEDFARELSLKSMSVESIEYVKDRLDGFVIGVVKEVKAHPNADKLKIAITDIGGKDVQIVCGGSNLKEGMKVFVALPGSKVKWHGEGDLVELKETKIRGEESYGMICAPAEVGFEKVACVQSDIWDLANISDAEAGTNIIDAFDMDDVIFDIEITTNRPDAMGIIGLAREGAAVTGDKFEWKKPSLPPGTNNKELTVKVDEQELCSRYMAVVIDGIKVGPSPMWLQSKLLLAGHRPINNIVDITNYILHEYGQPLHAFDYEKLAGNQIIVRRAKNGEKFVALDENEYELSNKDLVIADSEKPVAIAGVMGGKESGTWDETTAIVFEAATFDQVSVRKTGRGLNLFSDSQLLFEKGLSSEAPEAALAKAIELTLEIAGGQIASEIKDVRKEEYQSLVFPLKPQKVRDLMGVDLDEDRMVEILTTLGFDVSAGEGEYQVRVPYWRDHDIEESVDLTEEIARIYGYHNIESCLPLSPQPNYAGDKDLVWESLTKKFLAANGYTEFFGYSFISVHDFERYDLDSEKAIKVFNPLSAELTHMRTSLMPSFLKDIEMNQGQTPDAKIFELSRIYNPHGGDLPEERTQLVFGQFGVKDVEEVLLNTKGVLEAWSESVGIELSFERLEDDKYWHSSRSAVILYKGKDIGVIGQVSEKYQTAFDVDRPVVVAYVDFAAIVENLQELRHYQPTPEFPAINRDIAIVIDEKVEFADIAKLIEAQSDLIKSTAVVEIYRGAGITDNKKSVTLSVVLRAQDRTLESREAEDVIIGVTKVLQDRFDAVIR